MLSRSQDIPRGLAVLKTVRKLFLPELFVHKYLTRLDHGLLKVFPLILRSVLVYTCSENFSLVRHYEASTDSLYGQIVELVWKTCSADRELNWVVCS